MASVMKSLFGNLVANEVADRVVKPNPIVDRVTQLNQALQEPIQQVMIPKRITYDLIKQTIVQVRVNELVGKGKLSKDEHLAEDLFCLVRHYESDTKLTYERILQAIFFVKTNDIMGAGQWSKEDHLAEYLYALVRLSGTDSPGLKVAERMEQSLIPTTGVTNNPIVNTPKKSKAAAQPGQPGLPPMAEPLPTLELTGSIS